MSGTSLLVAGAHLVELDPLGALLRGGISAAVVALLLLAARRWGRDLAGLLTGLPTVTGPAMAWLALDRGSGFAAQAAQGALAAAVPCALFALTYSWLSLRFKRLRTLFWAVMTTLLSLQLLFLWPGPMMLSLAVVVIVCAACVSLMPHARQVALSPGARITPWRAGATTVLVSGAVTALASLLAQLLGPFWAGVLTSLPVLAGAILLELHRQGCSMRVQEFLRGYTMGLLGRSVFVVVFGVLLVPLGLPFAMTAAVAAALLLGWTSLTWMRWRDRLMRPSTANRPKRSAITT